MNCSRALASLLLVAAGAWGQARFPGDSPTRFGAAATTVQTTRVVQALPGTTFFYSDYGLRYPYDYGYYGPYPYARAWPGACRFCGALGFGCGCGPVYLPPVTLDPGRLYGPRALLRFWGADDNFGLGQPRERGVAAAPAEAPVAEPPPAGVAPPPRRRVAVRPAAAGIRARAWKFIDHGDRHFKAERYREALGRYKKAADSDASLAAARFRLGFAYLVLGSLDRAAMEFRRGLQLDPEWPNSDFVLDDLFENAAARRAVYAKVAEQLEALPNDAEARLLAGTLLHFDGKPAAAEKQFRRVIEITGQDAAAELFLPRLEAVEPPQR